MPGVETRITSSGGGGAYDAYFALPNSIAGPGVIIMCSVYGVTEDVKEMADGMAGVPDELAEAGIESAEECPGECIYIEVE